MPPRMSVKAAANPNRPNAMQGLIDSNLNATTGNNNSTTGGSGVSPSSAANNATNLPGPDSNNYNNSTLNGKNSNSFLDGLENDDNTTPLSYPNIGQTNPKTNIGTQIGATTKKIEVPAKYARQQNQLMSELMKFIFPPHLEQPESTGRLDLYAHIGPVDENGRIRGGMWSTHCLQDHEVRRCIFSMNEKLLYDLFLPRAPETVETIVKEILPKACSHCYTELQIKKLLKDVTRDSEGRLPFNRVQDVILADQQRRLKTLIHGGNITLESRFQIPFQTMPGKILTTVVRKKKLLPPQEFQVKTKRLHAEAGLIAPVEMQNLSSQLSANIQLLRPIGDIDDKWDRYCALRQVGQASYVRSRNTGTTEKFNEGKKSGTAISDLIACRQVNGPLTAPKVTCLSNSIASVEPSHDDLSDHHITKFSSFLETRLHEAHKNSQISDRFYIIPTRIKRKAYIFETLEQMRQRQEIEGSFSGNLQAAMQATENANRMSFGIQNGGNSKTITDPNQIQNLQNQDSANQVKAIRAITTQLFRVNFVSNSGVEVVYQQQQGSDENVIKNQKKFRLFLPHCISIESPKSETETKKPDQQQSSQTVPVSHRQCPGLQFSEKYQGIVISEKQQSVSQNSKSKLCRLFSAFGREFQQPDEVQCEIHTQTIQVEGSDAQRSYNYADITFKESPKRFGLDGSELHPQSDDFLQTGLNHMLKLSCASDPKTGQPARDCQLLPPGLLGLYLATGFRNSITVFEQQNNDNGNNDSDFGIYYSLGRWIVGKKRSIPSRTLENEDSMMEIQEMVQNGQYDLVSSEQESLSSGSSMIQLEVKTGVNIEENTNIDQDSEESDSESNSMNVNDFILFSSPCQQAVSQSGSDSGSRLGLHPPLPSDDRLK